MKASRWVRLTLLGSAVWVAGCNQQEPVAERAAEDGVPVREEPAEGYHHSPHYGGFIPLFIPIGGLGRGMNYQQAYAAQPAAVRNQARYPAPGAVGKGNVARGGWGGTGARSASGTAS